MTKSTFSRTAPLPANDPEDSTLYPRAESAVIPFIFYCCLLLLILGLAVPALMPSRIPLIKGEIVPAHQKGKNFILAEKLIAPHLPLPPTEWSMEPQCGEIGHGVWYAQGIVQITSPMGQAVTLPWKSVFIPETFQPLYLSVGTFEQGDYLAALRQAGINREKP